MMAGRKFQQERLREPLLAALTITLAVIRDLPTGAVGVAKEPVNRGSSASEVEPSTFSKRAILTDNNK